MVPSSFSPPHDHHAVLPQHNHSQEGVRGLTQRLRYPVALGGVHGAAPEEDVVASHEVHKGGAGEGGRTEGIRVLE